jgi:hypothetical protein
MKSSKLRMAVREAIANQEASSQKTELKCVAEEILDDDDDLVQVEDFLSAGQICKAKEYLYDAIDFCLVDRTVTKSRARDLYQMLHLSPAHVELLRQRIDCQSRANQAVRDWAKKEEDENLNMPSQVPKSQYH